MFVHTQMSNFEYIFWIKQAPGNWQLWNYAVLRRAACFVNETFVANLNARHNFNWLCVCVCVAMNSLGLYLTHVLTNIAVARGQELFPGFSEPQPGRNITGISASCGPLFYFTHLKVFQPASTVISMVRVSEKAKVRPAPPHIVLYISLFLAPPLARILHMCISCRLQLLLLYK